MTHFHLSCTRHFLDKLVPMDSSCLQINLCYAMPSLGIYETLPVVPTLPQLLHCSLMRLRDQLWGGIQQPFLLMKKEERVKGEPPFFHWQKS